MKTFKDLCVDNLSQKCLNKKQVDNISNVITDADFEPLKLPIDSLDRDKVSDCLKYENLFQSCSNCSKSCGLVLRRG